jgi:hypothetical protein
MISASIIFVGQGWRVNFNGRVVGLYDAYADACSALRSTIEQANVAFILVKRGVAENGN